MKEAREEANRTDVVELSTSVILDRLFAPLRSGQRPKSLEHKLRLFLFFMFMSH